MLTLPEVRRRERPNRINNLILLTADFESPALSRPRRCKTASVLRV